MIFAKLIFLIARYVIFAALAGWACVEFWHFRPWAPYVVVGAWLALFAVVAFGFGVLAAADPEGRGGSYAMTGVVLGFALSAGAFGVLLTAAVRFWPR